jgi:hypothetical protein
MEKAKNFFAILGLGITIGVVIVVILLFVIRANPTKVTVGGVEFEIPTPTISQPNAPSSPITTPTNAPQPATLPTTIPQIQATNTIALTTRLLSLNLLKQVLDETSNERVEITLGKLREPCNQGIVTCYDHPSSNWSITGPAVIGTDPLQQPIIGAQVIKVNKDATGNWLPNWPIGLFYVPAGQNVLVPTPGVAYPLEDSLPAEWIIR